MKQVNDSKGRLVYIVCDTQAEPDSMPLIAIFTLGAGVEEEDVQKVFSMSLTQWKPDMDCLPERHAADEVCHRLGVSVEFVEASREYRDPQVPGICVPQKVYLLEEYHSDEDMAETTCYAQKEDAIAAWRLRYGTVAYVWDVVEDVRSDEFYRARSKMDESVYFELTLIEKDLL